MFTTLMKIETVPRSKFFQHISAAVARILTAKLHSADVERLISTSHLAGQECCWKQNLFLYVHYSVPSSEEWDPHHVTEVWLNEKSRRCRDCTKGRNQACFKGVLLPSESKREDHDELPPSANNPKKF